MLQLTCGQHECKGYGGQGQQKVTLDNIVGYTRLLAALLPTAANNLKIQVTRSPQLWLKFHSDINWTK